jgi:flavin-dependent dehydrogenase
MDANDAAFDVAIIGAGPAGSAAAIELARAGRRTLVVEKKHFPREKVCGGCLSGTATARLRELLGSDRPLPGVDIRRITMIVGRYRITCEPNGATRMAPRSVLDARLADAAAAAGAVLRYGQTATLTRDAGRWAVMVGQETIRARVILLACGMSGLPRKLGIRSGNDDRRLIGRMWFQPAEPPLPPLGHVEMHWLRGGYVGLATPSAERCVVAVASDASEGSGSDPLEALRRRNPRAVIWERLSPDAPRRYNAIGTAGFPRVPDRLGDGNVLLIGDAAGFEEPYSGEGIGQAMRSATCAVRAILEADEPLPCYTALMRRRHRGVMRRTRIIRRMLDLRLIHYLAENQTLIPGALFRPLLKQVHVKGAL